MQHLSQSSRRHRSISGKFSGCQGLVRFSRCIELNHMLHRLCGPPSIHLSFNLATVLWRSTYRVSCATKRSSLPTASRHRLRRGLPGYLILFAPHFRTSASVSIQGAAFATGIPQNIYAFHRYTLNSPPLSYSSLSVWNAVPRLSPGFHIPLNKPPTRALRPVIPINVRTLRITGCWHGVSRYFFCR